MWYRSLFMAIVCTAALAMAGCGGEKPEAEAEGEAMETEMPADTTEAAVADTTEAAADTTEAAGEMGAE